MRKIISVFKKCKAKYRDIYLNLLAGMFTGVAVGFLFGELIFLGVC